MPSAKIRAAVNAVRSATRQHDLVALRNFFDKFAEDLGKLRYVQGRLPARTSWTAGSPAEDCVGPENEDNLIGQSSLAYAKLLDELAQLGVDVTKVTAGIPIPALAEFVRGLKAESSGWPRDSARTLTDIDKVVRSKSHNRPCPVSRDLTWSGRGLRFLRSAQRRDSPDGGSSPKEMCRDFVRARVPFEQFFGTVGRKSR